MLEVRVVTACLALALTASCGHGRSAPPTFELPLPTRDSGDALATFDARSVAFVTTHDAPMLAVIDRAGQRLAWTQALPASIPMSPIFHAGHGADDVIVAFFDGRIQAYRRDDGALSWEATTGEQLTGAPAIGATRDGDVLYLGAGRELVAFDLGKRAIRWSVSLTERWTVEAPPVVDGRRLYLVVGEDVVALDVDTGAVVWRHPTTSYAGGSFQSAVLVSGRTIVTGTPTKDLIAVAASDGARVWTAKPKDTWTDRLDVAPIALGDAICFAHLETTTLVESTDGPGGEFAARATCVEAETGRPRWSVDLPLGNTPRFGGSAAARGRLWLAYQGELVGFAPADGARVRVTLPASIGHGEATLIGASSDAAALFLGPGGFVQVGLP